MEQPLESNKRSSETVVKSNRWFSDDLLTVGLVMVVREDVRSSCKMPRVGVNLRASAYLHQGDRRYMEDEFVAAYQRTADKKDIEYAFFGIFDGHGGEEAAHYAKDHLMDNIVSQRTFWSDDDADVLEAIREGFIQTHMAMWKVVGEFWVMWKWRMVG